MRRPVLSCLELALLLALPAHAQDTCDAVLQEAERGYRAGSFAETAKVREVCLEGRATTPERLRAYALLAKIHLADDQKAEAAAAIESLIALDPEFRASPRDPWHFKNGVDLEKSRRLNVRVGSVSKVGEPLREAPATVVVVTAEEIERRGYVDLEEVLHDLPGFDLSRGNGDVYTNVYMRGYRSDASDRMLFLIDGVEQNDLQSNTAYISRQYPLSNVAQIEVVYGPASTIYGPNAFTGVISVATKSPQSILGDDKKYGVSAQLGGGAYGTRYVDAMLAGRAFEDRLSYSVTGRLFRSDEPDLSGFTPWDYDFPSSFDNVDYAEIMRLSGPLAAEVGPAIDLDCYFSGYCELIDGSQGLTVELTDAGVEEARSRDLNLIAALAAQGRELGFDDSTDDFSLDARVRFGNLTVGLMHWRRDEGSTPWYTDVLRTGGGNTWVPEQTTAFTRFVQPLGRGVLLTLFARYKIHETGDGSEVSRLLTFAGQALDIVDLAVFLDSIPSLQRIRFDQKSSQLRGEMTLYWERSPRFNLLGGLELRSTSVQAELESSVYERIPSEFVVSFFDDQLTKSQIDLVDLGIFVQAAWRPRPDLKLVAGGRIDTQSVKEDEVFAIFRALPRFEGDRVEERTESFAVEATDSVFNPRLAIVWSRGRFVSKAIYAEALKDAASAQRYARVPGVREFVNPDLSAERVRNFELHFGGQLSDELSFDAVAYQANYSNSVALRQRPNENLFFSFPSISGQLVNIGRLEILGLQLSGRWQKGALTVYGNYTFTDPKNVDPADALGDPLPGVDSLRIGDIASHRLNLGIDAKTGVYWGWSLRSNYVGERRTGVGTTVVDNPLSQIDAYLVTHATLSYHGFPAGATWQLIVRNLFNTTYNHPGVQRAGVGFASQLPQSGRTGFLRLLYHW